MRVLVTWGSERGGTEGLAYVVSETLRDEGCEVDLLPAKEAIKAERFDAVIVGGALYANRWHRAARRFVNQQEKRLRRVPVWFFSSGPLDDSAEHRNIPPTEQVLVLMERVGAQGHATFGGRLASDARGFPANAMAKTRAGDWRRVEDVRAWASTIARRLPAARAGVPLIHPARSVTRLVLHGLVGWAACAVTMGLLLASTSTGLAIFAHAIVAPLVFAAVARSYFGKHGARDPMATASFFTAMVAVLDLVVVAGIVQRSLALFESLAGFWLPLVLIFATTAVVGGMMSTLSPVGDFPGSPLPRAPRPEESPARAG